MELAVNLFNKGLLMDTNPMVQGNDSLSDALNATFMTMNGNEVILLNDMGNRRVDGAFLPPGYLPVGMKEYGGIIYVASYNPITNKSQIGSFPSPERNIQPNEIGGETDLQLSIGTYNSHSANQFYTKNIDGIPFLVSRTILTPITNDVCLHAGDKFTVYSEDLYTKHYYKKSKLEENSEWEEVSTLEEYNLLNSNDWDTKIYTISLDITNFNNFQGGKVRSPKNKKYTLALGVINSLNEFVDITKSLVRWDSEGPIDESSMESELIRFNTGYFIAKSNNISQNNSTIADSEFLENREVMPINTYSFKLIGPLYLKTTLNTILGFTYGMNVTKITKNENDYIVITIRGNLTYNCPDGIVMGGVGDDTYYTLGTGLVDPDEFKGFTLFIKNEGNNEYYSPRPSVEDSNADFIEEGISLSLTSYNKETNLYSLTLTKKFTIKNLGNVSIINYYLCVSDTTDTNNEYYLKELSLKGIINTSLIGSGELNINIWRYNWDNNEKILNYGISAYPKSGERFQNLILHYKGLIDPNISGEMPLIPGEIESGYYNENIAFLLENEMYLISLSYEIASGIEGEIITIEHKCIGNFQVSTNEPLKKRLWILTTPYFNKYYNTLLDFSSIEEEKIEYNFDEKVEVEKVNYNTYSGLGNSPYYSRSSTDRFDFLNEITANISLKASFKNSDNLEDIGLPRGVVTVENTSTPGNSFDIYIPNSINGESDFTGTLEINESDSLGIIGDLLDLTNEVQFSINLNSSDASANNDYLEGVNPTQCKLTLIFINYNNNFTEGTITVGEGSPESITISSGGTFIKDQIDRNSEVTISITGTLSMGVEGLLTYEKTFTITDDISRALMFIPIRNSIFGHRAVRSVNTPTNENSIHISLYNNLSTTIEAEFTQPFIMAAQCRTNIPVDHYLISARNYLALELIDTLIISPQIEIEHYNNIDKFCIERGSYSTDTIKSTSNSETIRQYLLGYQNSDREIHLKSNVESYSEGFNLALGDLNRVLIAGVGEDKSNTHAYGWVATPPSSNTPEAAAAYNAELAALDAEVKSAIKVWMKYKNDIGQDCWAILAEGYANYGTDITYSTFRGLLKSFISTDNTDNRIKNDFYGSFGNSTGTTGNSINIWIVHNRNYYLLKDFSIVLPVIVYFNKSISLSNVLLKGNNNDLIEKLPIFTTDSETVRIESEIRLNSIEQTNNNLFIDMDVYDLLGKNSIKYWTDPTSNFFTHLSEIDPLNNLFKVSETDGSILALYNLKEIEGFGPSLPIIFDNRIKYIFLRDLEYYKDTDPILYYDCPRIAFDLPNVLPNATGDIYYASFEIPTSNN